jgi:bacillolysin
MKKLLFYGTTAILSSIASISLNAQPKKINTLLHQAISMRTGVSQHFVTFTGKQQVNFDPKTARTLFGLDGNSDLVLLNTVTDKIGFIHYRYYQAYQTFPIENTMYIVHTRKGLITGATGSIVTEFYPRKAGTSKPISSGQAINIATKYMRADKYAWQDGDMEKQLKTEQQNEKATYFPTPSKVWFCPEDTINARTLRLCYKVDVFSLQPFDRQFIFVDMQTGRVLGAAPRFMNVDETGQATTAYSGSQTIHSDRTGANAYRLHDLTKNVTTLRGDAMHTDYTNTSHDWALTGADQFALDVHFGVAAAWSYYKDKFDRNSIDDMGFPLLSWVNSPLVVDNAGWSVDKMIYGISVKRPILAAIDMTGHELTHGITQHTSQLIYSKESGAINESISDIMGKCVQFFAKPADINWIVGNDLGNGGYRHFEDPNNSAEHKQADTYRGLFWVETIGCTPKSGHEDMGGNDLCGVHENSGIGNFMFYLLVNGGHGQNDNLNDYWVSGIGVDKAAAIIYRTETAYLTPTSQYEDWWKACKAAASELYGRSSNEFRQVENAWFAIGFGNKEIDNLAFLINKPDTREKLLRFDGTNGLQTIQFRAGDSVVIRAGGCAQTGGIGDTWKRFVDPQGPNADRLYFCTIGVDGVTGGMVPLRSLPGQVDPTRPDIYTVGLPKRVPVSGGFFRLGYVDDDYHDNGYSDHDDGTGDQCKNCGDAFMTVIIYRKKP